MPPPGTADSGSDDPASESSEVAATSEPKSYLVMSGGEGYIDFRLGTRSSSATILNPSSLNWFCMYRSKKLGVCESISRYHHCLYSQATKAVNWKSPRAASSQRPPRPSRATSLSGRSRPHTID